MTDREKLISHLKYCSRYDANCMKCERWDDDCGDSRCVEDLLAKAAVALEQQKWIPVTERLPQHGENALCRLTFNELRILQWDNVGKWWLGYGTGDDWSQKDVTHWMPLPEPPKEECHEKENCLPRM